MHIEYKDVEKLHGSNARVIYREIAEIAGGDPSPFHEGGMNIDDPADIKKVEKLLHKEELKKDGNK